MEDPSPGVITVLTDGPLRHRLARVTKRILRKAKPLPPVRRVRSPVLPPTPECLNVRVCPESLDRAMRIMDALLLALDQRGIELRLDITWDKKPRTSALVDGEDVALSLTERTRCVRVKHPRPDGRLSLRQRIQILPDYDHERVSTGHLVLEITNTKGLGVRRLWEDRGSRRIEGDLTEFVAALYDAARALKEGRIAHEKEHAAWEERKRKEEMAARRRAREADRLKSLSAGAEAWRATSDFRAYIGAVEAVARERGQLEEGGGVQRWLDWARAAVEQVDPLAGSLPSIEDGDED